MPRLRIAALAGVLALATTLSGCIMYVGPHDKDFRHHHHDSDDRPAPDERPADTLPSDTN